MQAQSTREQTMVGKAKGVPRDTTITLRLPRELHDRLKKAAAGRSVSEDIRRRLETTLLYDLIGEQKTRNFIDAIGSLTRNVRPYYGRWHENPYAFEVLKTAIDTLLVK